MTLYANRNVHVLHNQGGESGCQMLILAWKHGKNCIKIIIMGRGSKIGQKVTT